MSFHYEDITTEEDKEYFYSLGLLLPLSSDYKPVYAYSWIIDREREAVLVGLGGGWGSKSGSPDDIPEYFALAVERKIAILDVWKRGSGRAYSPEGKDLWYEVSKIQVEKSFPLPDQELIQLIKEAMTEYGISIFRKDGAKVRVHFENMSPVHVVTQLDDDFVKHE